MINDFNLGKVQGDYSYSDKLLSFKVNRAILGKSIYRGEIDFIWDSDLEMKLKIDVVDADFTDLRSSIPEKSQTKWILFARQLKLYGPMNGKIKISGPITRSRLSELTGNLDLEFLPGVNLYAQAIESGSINLHLDNDFIYLDRLQLNSVAGNLNATGKFDKYSTEFGANFDVEQFNLAWLSSILPIKYDLQGVSNISVQVSGASDNLVLNANWHAFQVALSSIPFGDADLSLFLRDNNFFIQGSVLSNKAFVDINFS